MKYIIDLPDNCSLVQWVMTSDKDGHAFFDFKQPRDLTSFDDELEEAYQKGLHAGESKCEYCDEYKRGLDDAWECARKIVTWPDRSLVNSDTFDLDPGENIFTKYSASRVIEKLKAYEEQQKADAEIKVGDEIKNTLELMNNAVGYFIEPTNNEYYRVLRYVNGKIDIVAWHKENCVRTGKHSYAVERMIVVLKGEQEEVCATCKYGEKGMRHSVCYSCLNQNRWENRKAVKIEGVFI